MRMQGEVCDAARVAFGTSLHLSWTQGDGEIAAKHGYVDCHILCKVHGTMHGGGRGVHDVIMHAAVEQSSG